MAGIERPENLRADLLDYTSDGLVVTDPATARIVEVNDPFCDLSGYDYDALVGMAISAVSGFDDAEEWRAAIPSAAEEQSTHEDVLTRADGSHVPVEASLARSTLDGQEYVVTTIRDIADRKERERQRKYQTALLEAQMETTIDGFLVVDQDRSIASYNDRFLDLWDIPESIVQGSSDRKALECVEEHLADPGAFFERRNYLYDNPHEESRDEIHLTDGRVLDQYTAPLEGEDGTYFGRLWTYRDVTEQREYERRVDRARERLRQIIDLVPDLIFVKNRDGEYLLANQAVADAYGKPVEAIEGQTDWELAPTQTEADAFQSDDAEVIESGEPKHIPEEPLTTADGETRCYETTKIPFKVTRDGGDAVLGYARDVTELKERESSLQRQRDDLELLNQILRHDVRNDLQVILAHAGMVSVEGSGADSLAKIEHSTRSAIELTETVGDLTETLLTRGTETKRVSLRPTLRGTIETTRSKYDDAVVIDGPIPNVTVEADDMLDAVFRNVISNAIQHNDADVPRVAVAADVTDEYVQVTITDNGPGIPDERRDEIFGKGEKGLKSPGTGIGLYLVNTLVTEYGGSVRVVDEDGLAVGHDANGGVELDGAAFEIELPRAQ